MSRLLGTIAANDLHEQRRWSYLTFGPPHGDQPNAGVIDHVRKEVEEIAADPLDLAEWIDVIILAFDGAMRAGYTPEEIVRAYHDKMRVNRDRRWPDWRTAEPGKAIEHIREEA